MTSALRRTGELGIVLITDTATARRLTQETP
jgi:hypothetical protein